MAQENRVESVFQCMFAEERVHSAPPLTVHDEIQRLSRIRLPFRYESVDTALASATP
ncbi:MAG: hypothetical protein GY725_22750 [bacterium]|nr:hypothetical protein [bacterium]